jgi:hypothetical protein
MHISNGYDLMFWPELSEENNKDEKEEPGKEGG